MSTLLGCIGLGAAFLHCYDSPHMSSELRDFSAERALLAAIIEDDRRLPCVIGQVNGDSFTSPNRRTVWYAMENLFQRGVCVDRTTMYEEIASKGTFSESETKQMIGDLGGAEVSDSRFESYLATVMRLHRLRDLWSMQEWVAQELCDTADPDVVTARVYKFLLGQKDEGFGEPKLVDSIALAASERTRRYREEGRPQGLDIGFETLLVNGGLRSGTLTVVGARTNVGKSAFAVHVAMQTSMRGTRTMFVTLEMTQEDLVDRMASALSGVNSMNLHGVEHIYRVENAYREVSMWPLLIWEVQRRLHIDQLRAASLRVHAKDPIGLLIVDYLQLMRGEANEQREAQVAQISRGLKALSMELGIPVIALAQVNRESQRQGQGVDRAPQLHHLRESGAIEQDADMVIMLDRPWMENKNRDPEQLNACVRKSRHSALFDMRLRYQASIHRMEEVC